MSLTLEGNGFSYTVPRGIDLTTGVRDTALGDARIIGRRGALVSSLLPTAGPATLMLEGHLFAASEAALRTAYQGFVEVLESGTLWLTDANLSRTGRVRLIRIATRRAPGPSTVLEVAVTLSLIDGVWQTALATAATSTSATLTLNTATPFTCRLVLTYAGTAPVAPVVTLTLGGTPGAETEWYDTIKWEGGNLLVNPSFDSLFTGALLTWSVGDGNNPVRDRGRTTNTCFYCTANAPAGWAKQTVTVNSSQTHTASAYFRADTASQDAKISIEWLTIAGASISTISTTQAASASDWGRVSVSGAAPSNAAHAVVRVEYATGEGYVTDAQMEQAASASPFTSSAHRSFVRTDRLAYVGDYSADPRYGHRQYSVDMGNGKAELYTSSGLWVDDLHNTTPDFWELVPGLQHISFSSPTWYPMTAAVRYRPRYT